MVSPASPRDGKAPMVESGKDSGTELDDEGFEDNPLTASPDDEEKPVKKYKCETCHYYERGKVIKWCHRCSDDYKALQDLSEAIQKRRGFIHRDSVVVVKHELNLLIGEVNELRLKVRRLGG